MNYRSDISEFLDAKYQLFKDIALKLWQNPELGDEEVYAHNLLTSVLIEEGFRVTKNHLSDTGFKCEYGSKSEGSIHAVIFCEYDALPEIGHGCGHNLIASSAIGAAIGVKYLIDNYKLNCQLTLFGTPAEENLGGKIWCINAGLFKDVDFSMMVHPREISSYHFSHVALREYQINFKGVSAHMSGCPWEGANALDAVTLAYQGLNMAQKHFKPNTTIAPVIRIPDLCICGIVPQDTSMDLNLRYRTEDAYEIAEKRMRSVFKGAAIMTHCTEEIIEYPDPYKTLISNKTMLEVYKQNLVHLVEEEQKSGVEKEDTIYNKIYNEYQNVSHSAGSTDMGNVSQEVPSIHPVFKIGNGEGAHTSGFAKNTNDDESIQRTHLQSKLMVMTIYDLVTQPKLLRKVKTEFELVKSKGFPEQSYSSLY